MSSNNPRLSSATVCIIVRVPQLLSDNKDNDIVMLYRFALHDIVVGWVMVQDIIAALAGETTCSQHVST